ncbi:MULTISPECIES: phasin family protein [Cupriavidus]|uniref:Phasin family protein n=1 Tax=Cupriavidus oxalaticus TaxID=96344 RepID=A0A4P7LEM4_9BURK|nr:MULTISPECIES: TIGR01841 family phasin [Cupriavidus]MBF6986247.1 TIGR01841 family phasin [Cupriavidus sp. IK-TO18]QBY50251.1 phasin family protein [Cupriavidus oxalaticus]TDF65272.1 phasin family protein [Cupriavidus sp. L7L]
MATPPNPFADFTKLMEQFRVPGLDMNAVIEARRKDIEALTEANKLAYEGMQAVMQKQQEIFMQTMQQLQAAAQQYGTTGNPAEAMAKHGELVQQALQRAFENMRELAETAQKAQAEALTVIGKRAEQNVKEAGALFQQPGKKG